jgi:hypothetical protein
MVARGKRGPSEEEHPGFVPVITARTRKEAEEYRQLFEDHDIDVIVGDEDLEEQDMKGTRLPHPPPLGGIAILVAEDMADEAREVLADRENVEEFQVVAEEDDEFDEEDDDDEDELDLVIDLDDEDKDLVDEEEEDEEFDEDEEDDEL